jgi:hypothetical protein
MIQIDTDVPLSRRSTRQSKYPFAAMDIGDSFFTEIKPSSLRGAAVAFSKRHDPRIKFAVRAEDNGARIWRTK